MRYRVIQEYDRRYPIRLMCRALAVSSAGYYAWRPPQRALGWRPIATCSRRFVSFTMTVARSLGVLESGKHSVHRATGLGNIASLG
jgi:hypothetical protein